MFVYLNCYYCVVKCLEFVQTVAELAELALIERGCACLNDQGNSLGPLIPGLVNAILTQVLVSRVLLNC